MITYFQAIVLGLLQGISELFPISSLGHSVILPRLLGWNIHQNDSYFLTFLVATHLATATVLFFFYFKDWMLIIKGIFRSIAQKEIKESDTFAKLGWLLIIGTIPAGIIGVIFEDALRALFASAQSAAFFLVLNGVVLYIAELLRKNTKAETDASDIRIAKLSYVQAAKVGVMQIMALIPGFSRTGATLSGSLLVGLSHEDSLRFSFLLATPIIGAAAVLKLPELFTTSERVLLPQFIVGALCAAAAAFLSVKFLTKYFRTNTLIPFAVYCFMIGGICSLIFLFR